MASPTGSKSFHIYYNKDEPKPTLNSFEIKLLIDKIPTYLSFISDKGIIEFEKELEKDTLVWKAYQKWGEIENAETEE